MTMNRSKLFSDLAAEGFTDQTSAEAIEIAGAWIDRLCAAGHGYDYVFAKVVDVADTIQHHADCCMDL